MNVQEALDELRNAVLRDKSSLKSGPPDQYWSDDSLILYLDDAQKRFARMSLCIRDDTTADVVQVTLASGVDIYQLHPSVIAVVSARHQDDTKDLRRTQHTTAVNMMNPDTESFEFAASQTPGKPTHYSTDEGLEPTNNHAIRMRFYGVPTNSTDDTETGKIVYLRTIRKPLEKITIGRLTADLEIPEDYHLDMLEWAAYRALRNLDIDAEDRAKAAAHKTRFDEAAAECKKEVLQKIFQPLTWAFGGGGYSYCKN